MLSAILRHDTSCARHFLLTTLLLFFFSFESYLDTEAKVRIDELTIILAMVAIGIRKMLESKRNGRVKRH